MNNCSRAVARRPVTVVSLNLTLASCYQHVNYSAACRRHDYCFKTVAQLVKGKKALLGMIAWEC